VPGHGRRVWLSRLVRLGVCLLAVAWLYRATDWQEIRNTLANVNWRIALLGLLVFGPAPVLIGVRLKWLLAVHDIHLSIWKALKFTFVSNFLIHALPLGTSGGDALKAWYVARETPHKHEAVTTVFIDRVVGVVGLVLLSGLMVVINWNNPAMASWGEAALAKPWMKVLSPRGLIGLLLAGMVLGGAVYFSRWTRRVLRLEQILARLPLAHHLQRLDQAVFEFRNHRRRVLACLFLAMVLQIWSVMSVFLSGWALGMVSAHPWRDFAVYLAYTPICFLCGALPLGVMEVIYVQLFARAAKAGTEAAAVSLSLMSRLIQLVWALPGGLAILTGQVSLQPPPTPADIPSETSENSTEASVQI